MSAFEIDTKKAVVAVTSLENHPIRESTNLLITAIARVHSSESEFPFLSEPVTGKIFNKSPSRIDPDKSNRSDENGVSFIKEIGTVQTEYKEGKYYFEIDNSAKTHWFVLKPGVIAP